MIAVFYHLGQIGENWRNIYTEHMERLEPVLKEATAFFLHVEGEEELPFTPANAIVVKNSLPEKLGEEGDTLESLHKFAMRVTPGWKILYTHSKGVTKPTYEEVKGWTDFLFSEVVDDRGKYLNALSEVGAAGPLPRSAVYKSLDCLGDEGILGEYFPHFSGNFWWATSKHIAELDPSFLRNTQLCVDTRRASEFWVCSSGTFSKDLGNPWACMNIYLEKEWTFYESPPEIWFLGKEPHRGCLHRAINSGIFSRVLIETENIHLFEDLGVEEVKIKDIISQSYKNVWFYCPNNRLFYFEVTERNALFEDLRDTSFMARNQVFIRADTPYLLTEKEGQVLATGNPFCKDQRLELKGIVIWKGLISA